MTDTIRELINRVLDYVARTPGADFEIWRSIIAPPDDNRIFFRYIDWDGKKAHSISRCDDKCWSQQANLNEDNLRYLLSQLEGEGQ